MQPISVGSLLPLSVYLTYPVEFELIFLFCLACRIVWYTCNMLYIMTSKKCFSFLESHAGTLYVFICTGVPVIAVTSSKCVIIVSALSELKAVAH